MFNKIKEIKNKMITIKVTVSQKEMIEKMAKERGFNVSQFIFYLLQKELEKKE